MSPGLDADTLHMFQRKFTQVAFNCLEQPDRAMDARMHACNVCPVRKLRKRKTSRNSKEAQK